MGTKLKYVFVPEDDSVVIGGTRYMLSVINLERPRLRSQLAALSAGLLAANAILAVRQSP